MAQDGSVLPASRFTRSGASLAGEPLTGLVDPRKALDLFAGGATIVFQGLQRYHQPLIDLCAELEAELGHPCQANAYLTPPGSQGFAVHSDTHDVFVFQTAGTKQWEVHDDEGAHDVLLEPGLCMYLPTGTPHAARAQDTVSLHVTIGINQLTWRGLVRRSVEDALRSVDEGHLPAGFLDDPSLLASGLAERLEAVAEAVRRVDAAEAASREVARFASTRPSRLRGGLHDVLAVDSLTDTTVLERRPGATLRLVADGDTVEVLLGDRVLHVPAWLRPVLEQVAGLDRLTPADLDLDESSRLVLCRRLVREGLLRVSAP